MNISQEKLADELKVSRQSISKWETDQSIPDLDKIILLSQFFNVTVDSLINDELDVEKSESAESNVFTKANSFKRVARILELTVVIMAIIYFIYFFATIIGQKLVYIYYGVNSDKFIFPPLYTLVVFIKTFCYIFFPLTIYRNINKKSITLEIVALSIVVVAVNMISMLLHTIEIAIFSRNLEYMSIYSALSSHLSRIGQINIIPNALFIIATTISIVVKRIGARAYVTPPLVKNEQVGTGFKVLSFFMGFTGIIVVWVLSFVLMSEWKKDQPIRRKEFKKHFITGMIIGIIIYLIVIFIRLITKKMI